MSSPRPEHGRHGALPADGAAATATRSANPVAAGSPAAEPAARAGMRQELRDAIAPRTVALVIGVLLLQLGFILSYVGAFHSPSPRDISLAVVAPAQVAQSTADQLDAIASEPVEATVVADEATARRQITRGETSAALVIDPTSTTDTLLVTTAGGVSVSTAVETVITRADATQGRTITTEDVVPLQEGDGRGLSGFYLVTGWIVGGYLLAALLGVSKGARPANPRRAAIRIGAMAVYAVVSGIGGAVVVGPVLGALDGHFWAVAGVGMLVVMSAATVTMAFQVLLGVLGIGVTVLLFVVLGNPSAGGAYQAPLLPPFWRALSSALPNGAAVQAIREIVYFGARGVGPHLAVIAGYAVVGAVVALAVSTLHHRRGLRAAAAA